MKQAEQALFCILSAGSALKIPAYGDETGSTSSISEDKSDFYECFHPAKEEADKLTEDAFPYAHQAPWGNGKGQPACDFSGRFASWRGRKGTGMIHKKNGSRRGKVYGKYLGRIILLSLVLFQFGCAKEQPLAGADYLLITDEELATLNANTQWETVGRKNRDSQDKNLFYFTNMFFEDDEFYYGKTCLDKSGKTYLEKISKNPVETIRRKYDHGDTDCMAFNGTELLTTANLFRELIICRYDKNLNLTEEHSLEWIQEQNVEGFMCWQMLPWQEGWIFLISIHPSGTDSFYNENHLLFLDSGFQVQTDYDLGFYDGAYSSFVLQDDSVYLTRYAQNDPNSYEAAYGNTIDVFSLGSNMIIDSYALPYTTNGRFVQGAPDDVLVLDRTTAQTDRRIPIVLLWPETGEVVPIVIDYEYPYASGPKPFISMDQDKIYFSYRPVVYSYSLADRTLKTVDLKALGFSDFLLFLKCSTS